MRNHGSGKSKGNEYLVEQQELDIVDKILILQFIEFRARVVPAQHSTDLICCNIFHLEDELIIETVKAIDFLLVGVPLEILTRSLKPLLI